MVLAVVLLAAAPQPSGSGAAAYRPSDENFPNPERGFYYQRAYRPQGGREPAPLNAAALRKCRDSGISLVRMYYVFSEFRQAPLSAAMLERIGADLATVRQAGMKVIPRFAYNFGPTGEPDASAERILQHLDQLGPALRANEDVIAFVEAGFIGTWGEWHHSTNGLFDPIPGVWWERVNDKSRAIVAKLLEVLPAGRMIALRYPRHKMDLYGPQPLAETEAFSATPRARTGAHNDCFLASKNDWGTYTNAIDVEKQFYRQDNLFVPQGGETCNAKEDAQPFMGCENALRQLDELHFNTLNIGYLQEVLDGWRAGGCMAKVERRLGYRFRLVDSEASAAVAAGGEFRLSFTVANEGFGNLYNQRPLEIVLRPAGGGEELRLATGEDPRRWMTGRNTLVQLVVRIPAKTKPGEYQVLLSLPDSSETLRGRPEYAIQLANAEVWEPAGGMNRLAHTVQVGCETQKWNRRRDVRQAGCPIPVK
jgi:hypothetical protein